MDGTGEFAGYTTLNYLSRVVSRKEWGARPPKRDPTMLEGPVKHVLFVHYTATQPCYNSEQCCAQMRDLQSRCFTNGCSDIFYNFMVGGDGNIYEGRGWFVAPETYRRLDDRLDPDRIHIGYIGDFKGSLALTKRYSVYHWTAMHYKSKFFKRPPGWSRLAAAPLTIIKREWWRALPAKEVDPFTEPLNYIIFTYTPGGKQCSNKKECLELVRELQMKHMDEGMPDVQYNFMIGGDDNLYEGRGWTAKPPKSLTHPELFGKSVEVAYLGDFNEKKKRHPTRNMWDKGWQLAVYALEKGLMNGLEMRFDWLFGADADRNLPWGPPEPPPCDCEHPPMCGTDMPGEGPPDY